jgi:MurNAc alpha-1-phosphate uridylyltransferase
MTITQAMILAAGLGTRMRPITDKIPKPLVRVSGNAMIDYSIDALKRAGVSTVAVNVHYLADQMESHLAQVTGLNVLISDERDALLNSGGGLAKGLSLLGRDPVYVMNADLFWVGEPDKGPTNLERLEAMFDANKMDMALLCVQLENTTGHGGKPDFSMDTDGRLVRYKDRPESPVVYAGALVLKPDLLDDAPNEPFNLNIYFDRAIATGRLYGMILNGHWLHIGTPEAILDAEASISRIRSGA